MFPLNMADCPEVSGLSIVSFSMATPVTAHKTTMVNEFRVAGSIHS